MIAAKRVGVGSLALLDVTDDVDILRFPHKQDWAAVERSVISLLQTGTAVY